MKKIKVLLASPRGFCAGVKRAIDIVELALESSKEPIYVRHEIVHNKRVVNDLKKKGVIFVKELEEVPKNSKVIFSAHGVSKKVKQDAKLYNQLTIDATCPLVSKVHQQIKLYDKKGYRILLIGHKGHPEVDGIEGQIRQDITVVENEIQAENLKIKKRQKVAYVTQTTLSLNDTSKIIKILKRKIPEIIGPDLDDICYATQNRQIIVKKKSVPVYRISGKEDIKKEWLTGIKTLGITSGASSPEVLVNEIIDLLKDFYNNVTIENLEGIKETIKFKPITQFS